MVFGRVMVTFGCAVTGAVFGYILGRLIELFPGIDLALTGMSGMSMPALLAAIGLMAGLILGILVSLTVTFVKYDVYAWPWHRRMRRARRSLRYGNAYATRRCHWSYGYGEKPWHESGSIEDTLQEIDGYLSYLEDMPKDQLASREDKIDRLNERLASLRASLHR